MNPAGLAGAGVLVTRPAHQAHELCTAIEAAGGRAVPLPLIDIVPRQASAVAAERASLAEPDIVVFVSGNAVTSGFDAFAAAPARIAAIGPATAAALAARGRTADIVPARGYDSEHLLDEAAFRDVAGKRVCIVRGDDGRELLARTLRARGAAVDYLPVYRRVQHPYTAQERADVERRWHDDDIRFVIAMSVATLEHLLDILPALCRDALRGASLVTPSDRVIQTALERMPQTRSLRAAGPGATQLVAAMLANPRSQTDDAHD